METLTLEAILLLLATSGFGRSVKSQSFNSPVVGVEVGPKTRESEFKERSLQPQTRIFLQDGQSYLQIDGDVLKSCNINEKNAAEYAGKTIEEILTGSIARKRAGEYDIVYAKS